MALISPRERKEFVSEPKVNLQIQERGKNKSARSSEENMLFILKE